jgi:2-methylisocitrate lyase-like PEP mutase family enzyme
MTLPPARKAKAEALRKLHDRSRLLILPNAWDAASARIFEEAGFPAIATTSAGIAYALGYADKERIPRDEMAAAIRRIVEAVKVPVTADVEAGYGGRATDVAQTVEAILEAGAVGMNLEDATHASRKPLFDAEVQVDRIIAAKEMAAAVGVPLVINARTDVFLVGTGEPEERLAEAVSRANAYREAGADCLFVPGVTDAETIRTLAKEIKGPLNILAGRDVPPARELFKLGVARVSVGSGPMRAAMGLLRRIAEELRGPGTWASLLDGAIPYATMNRLMAGDDEE